MSKIDHGPVRLAMRPAYQAVGRIAAASARYDAAVDPDNDDQPASGALAHGLKVLAEIKACESALAAFRGEIGLKLAGEREEMIALINSLGVEEEVEG